MQVTNTTGQDLYVAALQLEVSDGEAIEVDAALADSLIAQGWKSKPVKRAQTTNKADEADNQED